MSGRECLFRIAALLPIAMPHSQPTVFVVDDDISVRESLESLIHHHGWHPETFSTARAFLDHPRVSTPCCLILDVSLPDLNGLDLQSRLVADGMEMPIIFITGFGDVPMTVRAMKAGAIEFLMKPFSDTDLLGAIEGALQRSRAAFSEDDELRILTARFASLTRREQEVMALVAAGQMNKQVAGKLGISQITVKAHRGRMMRKMQARSLADLVTMAARLRASAKPPSST